MRLHPHLWHYMSSKHRICVVCGETESDIGRAFPDWLTVDFESWKAEYPEQVKMDQSKKDYDRKWKSKSIKDKQKGKQFIKEVLMK